MNTKINNLSIDKNKMLPTFVIIGAQKSASTFMQECLSDHSDIFLPHGETPFFESPDYENADIKELSKLFNGRTEKCLGIKRPNYIGKPEVPARIQKHLPNSKLIAVLRNPVDRAISAYFHNVNYGFIPPIDVEIGIRKIISKTSFVSDNKRSSEIIEFGYYYKYLKEYNYFIKNNNLLIFLHEDIISSPLDSIQIAYKYLDVNPNYIPKSLDDRPMKVLYNIHRLKWVVKRNRLLYMYNADKTRLSKKQLKFTDKVLAYSITKFDEKILSLFFPNQKPQISQELKNILYDLYLPDIKKLEKLIDRDLSIWKPKDY
ncbi:sulfotransferase domain-containing protein [Draconibacterium sp. IB214405]|uniref:sulfotransferase domain-containing protein n=1 Tax=Draconibacterium sp. IB214405 TaxID=3097352 RepID=UPI002A0B4A21|nr:sulfotransferase domain-containing protein [Draconibacterium sp. IB214405]MDX8339290.1 sulfotransferase domain-containing protein [Draconibacterium sp. IB214405]